MTWLSKVCSLVWYCYKMTDILSKISRYSFHILRCTKLLPSSPDVTFSTNWNKKTASQIPKEISWAWWITITECQAADFLTGVHELTTSLVSLVPISLPGSVSSYPLACFRFSHLLSLTFFLLSNLQLFLKIISLLYCCSTQPCFPFLCKFTESVARTVDILLCVWTGPANSRTFCFCVHAFGHWNSSVSQKERTCLHKHKLTADRLSSEKRKEELGIGRENELHFVPATFHWHLTLYLCCETLLLLTAGCLGFSWSIYSFYLIL